ncbi:Pyridoxine 5'-phosphate oxidase, Rv1155 [Alloactinosynnema sp. L-07]|uniref:PPOX class F420-dependent oxidoreductase n=1 Tax=Alloactinosynnema sp. L-07 TaxID=1653480 RepID=UPI00065F0130|nr:PPOX class F420-dependent oxidoreductase [Alloactinosynnema sp. L-07]CRK56008.1 Pyridoxine 5'-phosphate oxidase, Rv1155 [Alloactinosynnema sp. L-07]
MADDALYRLLRSRPFGVLITLKRDGRPQSSNVLHHFDEAEGVLRVSVTDGRAKTANLRRDARATYHVSSADGWQYAVVEGEADFSEVARDPHDAAVDELVELYRNLSGEHPNWDEYRAAMVSDGRLVLRIKVDRIYGTAR